MAITTKSTSTELYVLYKNKNMSQSLKPYVQGFSFSKTIAGSGDSFSFTLADPQQKWMAKWKPKAAADLYASAKHWGFDGTNIVRKVVFGHFEINSINVKAPPHTVSLTATSIPKGKGAKTKRTETYKKCNMRSLVTIIAKRLGLKMIYKANSTPSYDEVRQSKENDLTFLKRICEENGFSIKVSTKYLTILDDMDLEAQKAKSIIKRTNQRLKTFDFTETLTNLYSACQIYYTEEKEYEVEVEELKVHKKTKKVTKKKVKKKLKKKINHTQTFKPKNPPVGDILRYEEEYKNNAVAKRKAQNKLREANKGMQTGTLTFAGLLNVSEGDTVVLSGFGGFDGKYIIVTYSGSFTTSGTESTLELRKCLVGY